MQLSGIISILIAFAIPLILGPLLASVSILCNVVCKSRRRNQDEDFDSNFICIACLTIVFVMTYSVNMVISEIIFEDVSIMTYVLLKYCLGTTHTLLSPVAILISYQEVRKAVVKVFIRGGTQQNNSAEVSEDTVKKELGHLN